MLKLKADGRYYVGSSQNMRARVESHISEPKVAWILASQGVAEVLEPVTPPEEPLYAWEMRETLARMIMHGFNKVRGWEYCSPDPLGNSDVDGIFKLICGGLSVPLCHRCGFSGHLSSACSNAGKAKWLADLLNCRPTVNRVSGSDVILGLIQEGGVVVPQKRKMEASDAAPSSSSFWPNARVVPPSSHRQPLAVAQEPARNGGVFREANVPEPTRFVSYNELVARKSPSSEGCRRCGRLCHSMDSCFARTTVDGRSLVG